MPPASPSAPLQHRHRRRARPGCALALAAVLAWCGAAPAAAQTRVWVPPANDSLSSWAADARARFRAATADSVVGDNYRPFEEVGEMSRRLLRALGPGRLGQGRGVEAALDSMGLDVEIVTDPAQGSFALVMVHNPYRFSAHAVGYLFWWYRDQDLRLQGLVFRGGKEPSMRVWWTGHPDRPYEWAIVDHERGNGPARFTLLRLNGTGSSWALAHSDEGEDPMLGDPGEAVFADLDHDGRPELIHWAIAKTDSLFIPCSDCPRLTIEKTFVERSEGFTLQESRMMPSPFATFVTYVRLLLDNRKLEAVKLVSDPVLVTRSLAAGWGVSRKPGTWRVEYGEEGERWPRWLEFRFDGPQGVRRYVVHFALRDGRWIIEQWLEPQSKTPSAAPKPRPPARPGAPR